MKITYILLLACLFTVPAFNQTLKYPAEVEKNLVKSGRNRAELEKVIRHYGQKRDSLKLKAAYFLIANMNIHYSANYYWADSLNRPVAFNELAYPTFEASLKAFEEIRKGVSGIHPVPLKYDDIDSIKSDFLIDNIERAFDAWKKPTAKNLSFKDFCEYLLPYRVNIEPLQPWRGTYQKHFAPLVDSITKPSSIAIVDALNSNLKSWFVNTYSIEKRKEPLPLLGPLQLLFRKQGPCEDMAGLGTYTLRSQGIPCAVDIVVYWATSSGRHLWNIALDENLHPMPFDPAQNNPSAFKIQREPAKVLRITYAKQPDALASHVAENEIPDGTLRARNYIDVTSQYWKVKDVEAGLFPTKNNKKIAYACVFNQHGWRPAWWGKIEGDKTIFPQMGCGAVYLPMYYQNGKLKAAGYPVALKKDGSQHTIIPDTLRRHTVTIREQEKYLIYRPGKHYALMYWDSTWKKLGEKSTGEFTRELTFDHVPQNALLLLVPEYSQGKERPFTISESGERTWW